MAVIEAGTIVDGLPVFTVKWQKSADKMGDSTLRGGLFAAIQSFASDAFSDEMDELRLKNLTICLKTSKIQNNPESNSSDESTVIPIILYAVADKTTRSVDSVREALVRVDNKIKKMAKPINTIETEKNEFLREIFEDYFKDLKLRPAERAKRLFG